MLTGFFYLININTYVKPRDERLIWEAYMQQDAITVTPDVFEGVLQTEFVSVPIQDVPERDTWIEAYTINVGDERDFVQHKVYQTDTGTVIPDLDDLGNVFMMRSENPAEDANTLRNLLTASASY